MLSSVYFYLAPTPSSAPLQCAASKWQCDNGDCIDRALRCNRVYDCVDGTDEFNCGRWKVEKVIYALHV